MATTTDARPVENPVSIDADCSTSYRDVAHTLVEFHLFPWDRIDDVWLRECGGYGSGGIIGGVDFDKPSLRSYIRFVNDDSNCEVWEIPRNLRRLLDVRWREGQASVRAKLRELIAP